LNHHPGLIFYRIVFWLNNIVRRFVYMVITDHRPGLVFIADRHPELVSGTIDKKH